jgi:hypothetical protein
LKNFVLQRKSRKQNISSNRLRKFSDTEKRTSLPMNQLIWRNIVKELSKHCLTMEV